MKKILLLTDAFYLLATALLLPIYAIFVKQIGGDLLDASWTYALYMFSAGLVIYFFARWEDKLKNEKLFVIAGYLLGIVGAFGYLFVNSPLALFVVQIILGISAGMKDPAYDALFSKAGKAHLA